MRPILLAIVVCLVAHGGDETPVAASPFEQKSWSIPANGVDACVKTALDRKGIAFAKPCSDGVFIRRVYLDVIGALPEPATASAFLADPRPEKRAELVERLLADENYADYWALKWCDLLRVKAEFPINLWPNAVQLYHHWIREAVATNLPYDQFARELLTASGSNFRVAPANFYRAVQNRTPAGLAEAVALTFMGSRIASWPQPQRDNLAVFFSRVAYKGTDEWKEQIVYCDVAASAPLDVVFPDGKTARIPAGDDPRVVFADWLTAPDNPWFARCIANRVWSWLLGRGIIHEPDDIRPDNPPVNPELLAYLQKELVANQYDLKHLFRLILNSRTYQQSPVRQSDSPESTALFACYPVRQLDAEVLADALNWVGGAKEQYESRIPEPFTWIPREERTIALADGSITSTFLQVFGRPPRDSGLESERAHEANDAQRLFLLNSTEVYKRIQGSIRLRSLALATGGDRKKLVQGVYLTLLSREPTAAELAAAESYGKTAKVDANAATTDLAWALVNSMEFLYRH